MQTKRRYFLFLFFIFTSHLFASPPVPISTCSELMNIKSGDFILAKSIDCSGVNFIPIGTASDPFTGSLNGAGNKISNLTTELFAFLNNARISRVILDNVQIHHLSSMYHRGTLASVANATTIESVFSNGHIELESSSGAVGGLIGVLQNNSVITQSLSTVNVNVIQQNLTDSVGGLVGKQDNSAKVTNSAATGTVTGSFNIGGLTGILGSGGVIDSSYATGQVNSPMNGRQPQNLGGLVGLIGPLNNSALSTGITNSYATGHVNINSATGSGIGGLVGLIGQGKLTPDIRNSYATGNISGSVSVGGLVGGNQAPRLHIYTSYFSGKIIAPLERAGGLIGSNNASSDYTIVYDSYWNIENSGVTTSRGGTGKTTQEMYQKNTYVNWDFTNIWKIDEGKSYPQFVSTRRFFYEVKTCDELQAINNNLNGTYQLTTDIDCEGINFIPIGSSSPFTGIFNGNGHTIFNLTINLPKQINVGLFANTNSAAIINTVLKNVSVVGSSNVGAIVGSANNTQISTIFSDGKVIGKNYSSGSAGGLVGYLFGTSTIANSRSIADVEGVGLDNVGGLVGYINTNSIQILNSYAKGYILGRMRVGGLVGYAVFNPLTISDVYSASTLLSTCSTSNSNCVVGGIIGSNATYFIENSYYDKQIAGFTNSKNGIGKTTAELHQKNSYSTWDFDSIWQIDNGLNYPQLKDEFNTKSILK